MRFLAAAIAKMMVWATAHLSPREMVNVRKALGTDQKHGPPSKSPKQTTVDERFRQLLKERSLLREDRIQDRTVYLGSEIVGVQPTPVPLVLSDDRVAFGAELVTRPIVCETLAEVAKVRAANMERLRKHRPVDVALVLAEDELAGLIDESDLVETGDLGYITEDPGSAGISYNGGIAENREHNARFEPYKARGLQWDHGEFHELLVEMSPFRRGFSSIMHVLTEMIWSVEAAKIPEDDPDYDAKVEAAEEQAEFVRRMLLENLYGGWRKFLREANYASVVGFAIFVEVFRGPDDPDAGGIQKLAFRFPKQVREWIVHPRTGELAAVKFTEPTGGDYVVRAENILLHSFESLGNDYEGMAYARSIVIWADVLKLLTQLEAVSSEKWGNAWAWASREDSTGAPLSLSDREELRDIIRDAIAEDDPIITLPDNTKVELTSPSGVIPDFSAGKRFALERMHEIWKSEVSLVAVGNTGAFAARESAGDEHTAFAKYFAHGITDTVNGANNTPHTGTIKKMIDLRYGGPPLPGRYPSLDCSLADREDPERFNKILQGAQSGLVETNDDVIDHVHEILELPRRVPSEKASDSAQPAIAPVQESPRLVAAERSCCPPTALELADDALEFTPLVLAEFDAAGSTSILDTGENRLAAALGEIMREHRAYWQDAMDRERRSNDFTAEQVEAAADQARELFMPRYFDAAAGVLTAVAAQSAQALLGQIGAQGDGVMSRVQQGTAAIRLKARAVAEEVFNRVNGMIVDRFTQFARGESTISLPILQASTVASIANKGVSTAFNAGRDIVADELSGLIEGGDGAIVAERSSVLDSATCAACEELDGARATFGSARYYDLSPPNKCEGWDRCRCIWTYIMPDEMADRLEEF